MKQIQLLLFFSFLLGGLSAQVTNDQINLEIRYAEFYGSSDNDASSTDEQSMLISVTRTDDNGNLTFGPFCTLFDCNAPCTVPENTATEAFNFTFFTETAFNSTIDFALEAWGDEGDQECIFDGNDQDFFSGTASADGVLSNPQPTNGRLPSIWATDYGSNNGFIFPANTPYNLKPQVIWTYANGNDCGAPLEFGELISGETKTHVNSNRPSPEVILGDARIGYTNETTLSYDSPDVYYSFTLTEASMVTLTTSNDGTNMDTYLELRSADCDTLIASNDDVSFTVLTSLIETTLEPGTYNVMVEGYSTDVGDFELSVLAEETISSTREVNQQIPIDIGPNPTHGPLRISTANPGQLQDATIELLSPQGHLLQQSAFNGLSLNLDLAQYPAGVYLVRVVTENGQMSRKVVVY